MRYCYTLFAFFLYFGFNALGDAQNKAPLSEENQQRARDFFDQAWTAYEKEDYTTAKKYLEQAAALGDAIALNNLGSLYEKGQGVKQDYEKARDYC